LKTKLFPVLILIALLGVFRYGNIWPMFLWNDSSIPTPMAEEILGVSENGEPIRLEAYFSHPPSFLHPLLDWMFVEAEPTFETKLAGLFSRAVPGSEIHAVLYQFDSGIVAREMERAKASGVAVRLVLDDSADSWLTRKTYKRLKKRLGEEDVHICARSACIGRGNNHNKIYLFSELRDPQNPGRTIRNVVVQTSENMLFFQRYFFNDMVILSGDRTIYEAYLSYWHDLREEQPNSAYYEGPHGRASSQASGVRVYFFPSVGHDPIVEQLRTVSCEGGGKIFVVQSLYKGLAANALTAELVRLKHQGCNVGAVLHKNETDNENLSGLLACGVKVWFLESIHSKIVMIDALQEIKGKRTHASVVFTGSLNRKERSLRKNDEALLRIVSPAVFKAYRTYFLNLQGRSFN